MRTSVPLRHANRILNHGPVVLVTSASGGRDNLMPAAWVMPLDFEPALVAAVIAAGTFTRELVDASGELGLSVPPASFLDAVHAAGQVTGREVDKWARFGLARAPASRIAAPLVDGCLAWLECRVVERSLAERHDLFVCEVLSAWADDRAFHGGEWHFDDPEGRTFHNVVGNRYFLTGEARIVKED